MKKIISVYRANLIKVGELPFENIVKSPEDAANVAKEFYKQEFFGGLPDREVTVGVWLNTKNEVTGIETISIGSLNAAILHPREVFKGAILHNAASIILAHNHPSGDTSPSPEDIEVTKRIIDVGQLMGIELLDHIIIGDGYSSLKEKGFV